MIWNAVKQLVPRPLKRSVKRAVHATLDSARYHCSKGKPDSGRGSSRHIIFVCKGNICRSAFAEYYLRRELSDETFLIESCGLDVDQGFVSPPEAIRVATEFELDLVPHRSKGLAACDLQHADLILPMEYRQYQRLTALLPGMQSRIILMRDFAPWPDRLFCNIDDPYGSDDQEFRRCFKRLQRSLDGLKNHLEIPGSQHS